MIQEQLLYKFKVVVVEISMDMVVKKSFALREVVHIEVALEVGSVPKCEVEDGLSLWW